MQNVFSWAAPPFFVGAVKRENARRRRKITGRRVLEVCSVQRYAIEPCACFDSNRSAFGHHWLMMRYRIRFTRAERKTQDVAQSNHHSGRTFLYNRSFSNKSLIHCKANYVIMLKGRANFRQNIQSPGALREREFLIRTFFVSASRRSNEIEYSVISRLLPIRSNKASDISARMGITLRKTKGFFGRKQV